MSSLDCCLNHEKKKKKKKKKKKSMTPKKCKFDRLSLTFKEMCIATKRFSMIKVD